MISVFDMIENIVRKGENAGFSIFSFSKMFSEPFCSRFVKSQNCVVKRKLFTK